MSSMSYVDGLSVLACNVKSKPKKGDLLQLTTFSTKQVAFVEDFYSILYQIHNVIICHLGENKTQYQINLRYACFPEAAIDMYCKLCPVCSLKVTQASQARITPIASYSTWERIQIDLIDMRYRKIMKDGKEYSYICHVIDHYSSFNLIWAQIKKDASEVVDNLEYRVFSVFGLPKIFHSDNGLEFKNQFVRALINKWPGDCKIVHGKPRCPWVQGKVEQSNGTLERCLNAKLVEIESDDWVSALPAVQYAMNISMQNTTKCAPYNIVFGQNPNMGKYVNYINR